jgi:glycosyltransferase involved in cell wall biosynthesis
VIGLIAAALAGTGARILTRHYSDYHTRIDKKLHVRLDRLCTGLSHAVIAVSQHTAAHLIEKEGARPDKIHVVSNGIDFDRVRASDPDATDRIRLEFAATDSYLLLIAARLHPEKGHHYLFQALPEIQQRVDRPVRLLVAGTGTYEAAYKEEVRSLGCEEMVSFLGFRKDIPDLIAAADLLVLPSVAEAFGLVLAEATHLGTPVVATRVGGIPEIIEDGKNGVLVEPSSSLALSQAIASLLNDPGRRHEITQARRESVERFRFEDMVRSYESVYRRIAARPDTISQ